MLHISVSKFPVDVRPVHGGVASRAPTRASAYERSMRNLTDKNLSAQRGYLRVAFETEIVVTLDEHLVGDGAVRVMAYGATFAQRFVVEHHRARLLAMAFSAAFVQPRHADRGPDAERSAMRCLHDVRAVGIVALDAIHAAFQDGMMLGQLELSVDIKMTSETRLRVAPGIDDQFPATPSLDVQAARSMTGFTAGGVVVGSAFDVQTGVGTGRKGASVIGMAFDTGFVTDESCAFNLRRNYDTPGHGGTGRQNDGRQREACDYSRRQDGAEIHSEQCIAMSI